VTGSPDQNPQRLTSEAFVALLLKNEHRVRGFVASLMPLNASADDIFQNSCLIALKKLGDFRCTEGQSDDEFVRWMCGIARFEVLQFYRKDKRKRTQLSFNSELIEELADMQIENIAVIGERTVALQECINLLEDRDKSLIRMRYGQMKSVKEIADGMNRSTNGIYKALVRVRDQLLACIKRKTAEGTA